MVNTEIKLIIFFVARDGEALYSQQKQDQEVTVADHEHLIAKFRLKLEKVGKTTRKFRYDLNQNPKDTIRKLLELISEFSKVAGYKLNTQKSLLFLYTNNEKSEIEIKESIP